MRSLTTSLYEELSAEINFIETEFDNLLKRSERSYKVSQETLQKLKEFIEQYEFKSTEEEIYFFKEIKPLFLCEVIFHHEAYQIEAKKPFGSKETIQNYFKKELDRVSMFFDRHLDIYNYLKAGHTNFDHLYFTRNSELTGSSIDCSIDIDPLFSTGQSNLLAKVLAFEHLSIHLHNELDKLDNPVAFQETHSKLRWTGSKVDLIEWGYGIFAVGCCNNGEASIKLIMRGLEIMFNIKLGNYYTVFLQNIRLRKLKEVTHFINKTGASLSDYVYNLDENPRQ